MTVIGLDLSLTGTGVCRFPLNGTPVLNTIGSKGTAKDSCGTRAYRLQVLRDLILAATGPAFDIAPDLVVVEGPSIGSNNPHTWDRAGLWWHVVGALYERKVPTAIVPPSTLKKWATGKGNADKSTVAAGVTRLFPDAECSNDNEFDSLCLAAMGAQHLGYDVPRRAHHESALGGAEWPPIMPLAS